MLAFVSHLGFALFAAQGGPAGVDPVLAVEACRAITLKGERLQCFDAAAERLASARAAKQVVVIDRSSVERARRGQFGFPASIPNPFTEKAAEPVLRELSSDIRRTTPTGYGHYQLTLGDGSVWQTTDRIVNFAPNAGDPIRIKRGPLGYRATSRGAVVQVRRIR